MPRFEQAGDESSRLSELHNLGEAYRDRGDRDEGERMLEETEVTEEDEQLFVDVGRFDDEFEDWVGVSEEAVAWCPEVREAS